MLTTFELRKRFVTLFWNRHALYLAVLIVLLGLGWRYLVARSVGAIRPMAQNISVPLKGAGELTARNQAQLTSRITLKVKSLLVEAGQVVERGQPLIALDATELEAQTKSYEAASLAARKTVQAAYLTQVRAAAVFQHARADAKRTNELASRGSGAISDTDLEASALSAHTSHLDSKLSQAQQEAAKQSFVQAEQNLEAARARLSEATVRAPFDGMVTARQCSVGDTLSPGAACMTVIELSTIFVKARFDESVLGSINPGDPVSVYLKSHIYRAVQGHIERVNRTVDPDTREFTVDVALQELPSGWALGERATIEVSNRLQPVGLAIPLRFFVSTPSANGAWIARNGRAYFVPLRLGVADRRHVEVIEGLDSSSIVLDPKNISRGLRIEPRLEP